MDRAANTSKRKWIESLPRSRMVYPERTKDRLKYVFWRALTPVHPLFRELCMPVRKLRGRLRRQDYLLGLVAPESLQAFVEHLISLGYRRHYVAWRDPDQLISLRLVDGFHYQYHLRVYKDGEVRGHYEYTPESYPFKHLKRVDMIERRDVFRTHVGKWMME